MTGKEAFKIWTPRGARWVDWVRPVPFVNNRATFAEILTIPTIHYVRDLQPDTAIILDLPGCESIREGLALSELGWRPIPLFNGTNPQPGVMALVDNYAIESALICGVSKLKKLDYDAPPAFLLDSCRTHRHKMDVSVFDNSWDLYSQDIPSAEYFLKHEINKVIVRGNSIQMDLQRILYSFQKKGITIYFSNGFEKPKEVSVKKPPRKAN